MNRLLRVGFELAGHWKLEHEDLILDLRRFSSRTHCLYAFVSDGEVKYVGKTTQRLEQRLKGYSRPGPSQSTNQKNHANIRELLSQGEAVDVLVLPDDQLLHYGGFHLNLAAGLEDSVIATLDPEWNGRRAKPRIEVRSKPSESVDDRTTGPPDGTVRLTLHPTYFDRGFFNVGVASESLFGGDGEPIEIYCGDAEEPFEGYINRGANTNNTPRVMGGAALRDWFQSVADVMQDLWVDVISPNAIHIRTADDVAGTGS